ncbi:hypothetical protein BH11MYX4_BH11MYX4_16420 [soil metagenome]
MSFPWFLYWTASRERGVDTGGNLEKPKRRTLTSPGLGSGLHPKQTVSTLPPVSGTRDRDEPMDSEPRAEKISGRRRRTSRPPVRVDEVGDVAVAIAGRQSRAPVAAPQLLKPLRELASAPIDHRDAFVLSLVDGKTSVQGVVDLAAMADGEAVSILHRLATLGIVRLP